MFKIPEKYRITENHQLASNSSYGNNGAFLIKYETYEVYCIASDGGGWEHVSVSYSATKIPSWNMMCFIKNMFWDEEDCVIQFHPPKANMLIVTQLYYIYGGKLELILKHHQKFLFKNNCLTF